MSLRLIDKESIASDFSDDPAKSFTPNAGYFFDPPPLTRLPRRQRGGYRGANVGH